MREEVTPENLGMSLLKTCECGNSGAHEGFYPCDGDGLPVHVSQLLCCDRCGKITQRISGKYAGHRSFSTPADVEE